MRKSGGSLHFFVNGQDCGSAATSVPSGIYAMIDLYGQCVQISVHDEDYRGSEDVPVPAEQTETEAVPVTTEGAASKVKCGFHSCCGRNIRLVNNKMTASRSSGFNHGLVFSAKSLEEDEIFEIVIDKVTGSSQWSGSIAVGITTKTIPLLAVPASALELRDGTWLMTGSCVMKDAVMVKENYGHSLDRLQAKTRIGVQRQRDGTFHVFVNGEDQGVAAMDIPETVHAVVDVYGMAHVISISSPSADVSPCTGVLVNGESHPSVSPVIELQDQDEEDTTESITNLQKFLFHKNCGQFISLDSNRTTARRVDSYNHGVVLSETPLPDNHLFQVCIRKLNSRWTGSVMIGVTAQDPDSLTSLPSTANSIKICPWIVVNNAVYVNGNKVNDNLRRNLDSLQEGDTLGVLIDKKSRLHLLINGEDLGLLPRPSPPDDLQCLTYTGAARKCL
ncbi:hypothetical protein OS493_006227 [Desmophyllum pertusum]|uniref:NHR domain-containing protein n=1 Tax=Desmophyllum pertusum TaxID=174260 RepID=A0A9X0A4E0_9CNID|nr:hypothetical protein OS493_006227 [Desmophyllum pertusum]